MNKKKAKERAALIARYYATDRNGRLAWLNAEARKAGMNYGMFVAWLGV